MCQLWYRADPEGEYYYLRHYYHHYRYHHSPVHLTDYRVPRRT